MTNRIEQKFQELKKKRKKAFIAFLTCGDPDLRTTHDLVLSFEKNGVDLIELGVPFSDPLADGLTIQESSQRALQKKVTLYKILQMVSEIRKKSRIPIALMSYYNPIFHYGEKRFVQDAYRSGVDGLILPDLPPEEAESLISSSRKFRMATVFFLSPTTTASRMKKIIKSSTGFIYYVSLTGVTGERTRLPAEIVQKIKQAKRMTNKPICVGFGISTPAQVKAMAAVADGVIVGSAIVKKIDRQGKNAKKAIAGAVQFVKSLTSVL